MNFTDPDDKSSKDQPRMEEPLESMTGMPFLPYFDFESSNELADTMILNGSFPINLYPFGTIGAVSGQQPSSLQPPTQQDESLDQQQQTSQQLSPIQGTAPQESTKNDLPMSNKEDTKLFDFDTRALPRRAIHAGQKRSFTQMNSPENHHVFTLVVGGRVFRLSWESITSDGPSNFFTNYFTKHKTRVMHIDRDPDIFRLVAHHLRGYYIRPTDDMQNQDLLSDARYYNLKRLEMILKEHLYVNVGGKVFRLSWDLLNKYGNHNYFTGPMKDILFNPHVTGTPAIYIDRDPDNFQNIVNHLRGYTIHIKDELHRRNLIKDSKYYGFRQLCDKLVSSRNTVEGFGEQVGSEVLFMLQDVRIANMLPPKGNMTDISIDTPIECLSDEGWSLTQMQYKGKFDRSPRALLIQMANIDIQVHHSKKNTFLKMTFGEADVEEQLKAMARLFNAKDVNNRIYLASAYTITVDAHQIQSLEDECIAKSSSEKCTIPLCEMDCTVFKWVLQRTICSVHITSESLVLCALRLEIISSRVRSKTVREFLPSSTLPA